ncbi:MAG TPA: hypothetical protein VGG34_09175 [Opitutaceae bacterium]|jgi:hypothetical protein
MDSENPPAADTLAHARRVRAAIVIATILLAAAPIAAFLVFGTHAGPTR